MASSYTDEYEDLMSQPTPEGDSAANTLSQIDIGGDILFGYGDASKNRAIERRQAQLQALKGKISAEKYRRLEESIKSNSADWANLTTQILGSDGRKLHDFYQDVQGREQAGYDRLAGEFGKYQSLGDLYNDPNFFGDVGDVTNSARPTEATVHEQRAALAKMKALSDPTESAQERFQRLMAQRETDANMKGARDSIAQNLKARGVYGSGAEVVQNMMSQADEANRRYMANLAADAQAQQRATQMLGMGADLAGKMRGAETQEGALANQVSMFNNQINQNLMNTRSSGLQSATGTDNAERNKMATTLNTVGNTLTGRERGDLQSENATTTGLTKGKIDINRGGVFDLNAVDDERLAEIDKTNAVLTSSRGTGGLIGGGMG